MPERGPSTAKALIQQAKLAGASIIQHHFADLDPAVVADVQAAGIEVWAWPPASLAEARIAYEFGAIGLMGDESPPSSPCLPNTARRPLAAAEALPNDRHCHASRMVREGPIPTPGGGCAG